MIRWSWSPLLLSVAACSPARGDGWTVTVYYTAVASFHDGAPERVQGCPRYECDGTSPADLGTGPISAGRYLNWSVDVGYWLDTAPRDSAGGALEPWRSAAADPGVLRAGSRFTITSCGSADDVAPDRAWAAPVTSTSTPARRPRSIYEFPVVPNAGNASLQTS